MHLASHRSPSDIIAQMLAIKHPEQENLGNDPARTTLSYAPEILDILMRECTPQELSGPEMPDLGKDDSPELRRVVQEIALERYRDAKLLNEIHKERYRLLTEVKPLMTELCAALGIELQSPPVRSRQI